MQGYKFTNQSKKELIENLMLKLEHYEVWYPNNPTILSEMQLYCVKMTATGLPSYNAPSGDYHDDCVCSLALAAWGAKRYARVGGGGAPKLWFGNVDGGL